jgi:hypothetical protein
MNSEQQRLRFGPVRLAPGISRGNTWALLLASFVGVANGVVFVFALIVRMTAPGDVNIRRTQTTPQA